jgi:DNA (cytosine-5)-methyltransferase 1
VRFGSLFTGIGALDLGLERAGMRVVWQVEVDPFCRGILERHWPDLPRQGDVRLCDDGWFAPVDLVAGGFPCQPVSCAGRGRGEADPRWLWPEFARVVRAVRPRWVLVENVPTLRTRGADRVLGDLEAAGYACWPCVVGARHVGAPHRRDRIWIVGRLADAAGERTRKSDDAADSVLGPHGRTAWETAWESPLSRGDDVAGLDADRREARRLGGVPGGERTTWRNDADGCHQWPTRPGEPQRDWEPPRTVESRLGRGAYGSAGRLDAMMWQQRLKALGNAVVPQVVEAIGRAILDVDGAARTEDS